MKARGLALAALLLLPLVPTGGAAEPAPEPWAPYDPLSDVRVIAIAAEGTTIAAALGPAVAAGGQTTPTPSPAVPTVGVPTVSPPATDVRTQRGDLAILDAEFGFARNGTRSNSGLTTALGKSHVAVSRAGHVVVALGPETATGSDSQFTQDNNTVLKLHYSRIAVGGNWSGALLTDAKVTLGGTAMGLALSDDGSRVAVLTQDGPQYRVAGYTLAGTTLASSFDLRGDGAPRAMAATGDLSRVLVTVQPNAAEAKPQVLSIGFGQSAPGSTAVTTGEARAVGLSREGGVALASGGPGAVLLFPVGAADLSTPINATVGAEEVTRIVVSEDGSRIATLSGRVLSELSWDGANLRQLWNSTLPGTGNVSVAMNKTGELVMATVVGNGIYLFSEKDGTPKKINVVPKAAALNGAGTRIVYDSNNRLYAAELPRALALESAAGNKVVAAKPVLRETGATFELKVRNPGSVPETIELLAPNATADLGFSATPASVVVKPDETVSVNVTVTSETPLTTQRSLDVVVRSRGSDARDNITLLLSPEFRTNVTLHLNSTEVVTRAGEPASIVVGVVNEGTTDTTVTLAVAQSVTAGREWALDINGETSTSATFTAPRGARTSVRITATPPADAANGTASTLSLVLSGANVSDSARVVFRINPNLGVAVNATGVTRFIEPGGRATYNVTVTNNGTLPRQYEAYYQPITTEGAPWAVEVPATPFRLDPNAKRTIQVTIIAPASAVPGADRFTVQVFARSIPEGVNETAVTGNVTLYAVASAPPPTPTPTENGNPIPFPHVASLALALALALALVRRRIR